MRPMFTLLFMCLLPLAAVENAGGSAPKPSVPGVLTDGSGVGGGMALGRAPMTFEVELVVIASDSDQAGLSRWAELAAIGYRVSHVVLAGDKQFLYLERSFTGNSSTLHLPAAVEQDRAAAGKLRSKIQTEIDARQPRAVPVRAPDVPSPR